MGTFATIFIPLFASLLIPLMAPWMNGAKEGGFDIEGFELANFIIGGLFARAGIPLLVYLNWCGLRNHGSLVWANGVWRDERAAPSHVIYLQTYLKIFSKGVLAGTSCHGRITPWVSTKVPVSMGPLYIENFSMWTCFLRQSISIEVRVETKLAPAGACFGDL